MSPAIEAIPADCIAICDAACFVAEKILKREKLRPTSSGASSRQPRDRTSAEAPIAGRATPLENKLKAHDEADEATDLLLDALTGGELVGIVLIGDRPERVAIPRAYWSTAEAKTTVWEGSVYAPFEGYPGGGALHRSQAGLERAAFEAWLAGKFPPPPDWRDANLEADVRAWLWLNEHFAACHNAGSRDEWYREMKRVGIEIPQRRFLDIWKDCAPEHLRVHGPKIRNWPD